MASTLPRFIVLRDYGDSDGWFHGEHFATNSRERAEEEAREMTHYGEAMFFVLDLDAETGTFTDISDIIDTEIAEEKAEPHPNDEHRLTYAQVR